MLLPQIPTDNLYKFVFVAGLTIMAASSLLCIDKYTDLTDKLEVIRDNLQNAEIKFVADSMAIDFEIGKINALISDDSTKAQMFKTLINSGKQVEEADLDELGSILVQRKNEFWSARANWNEKRISWYSERNKIRYNLKKLERTKSYFIAISFFCMICFMIGLRLAIKGHKYWNTRAQKPTDERIQIELSKLKSSGK